MELIYSWIEKYRTYRKVELNFSKKFFIKYDSQNNSIMIERNKDYCSLNEKHIANINAIVGKNGVGKTNLLDLIGMRVEDRNKNNDEFEIRFKNGQKIKGMYRTEEIIIIKNSIYFFIYYLSINEDGEELFCIEGNDIDSFREILEPEIDLDQNYFREKYWFSYICTYSNGKLHVKYKLNHSVKDRYISRIVEKDRLAIISFREKLNKKDYDSNSTESADECRMCIPRRVTIFNSKFLSNKIQMLYDQMKNEERIMFKDDNYVIEIKYNDFALNQAQMNESEILYSYEMLKNEQDRARCRILAAYIYKYYKSEYEEDSKRRMNIEKNLKAINIKGSNIEDYISYYKEIVSTIFYDNFENIIDTEYAIKSYNEFFNLLFKSKSVLLEENILKFNINDECNIEEIKEFIRLTIDQESISHIEGMYYMFYNFFEYEIYNMSDGEKAFLGFYASLHEQISQLAANKDEYIILLDEPEARMHPELARNFINDLIKFLDGFSKEGKKFQIIISTHSPFILSDIYSGNIVYLEKNSEGYTIPLNKNINTFGANIHSLLKDGFFMNSTIGEYAKQKINNLISALKPTGKDDLSGNFKYKEIDEIVEFLKVKSIEDIKNLINIIGEPIISIKLKEMLDTCIRNGNKDIYKERLKNKIELLQKELDSLDKE